MKKECNITRDLLPLYIEELCSEDSREYVEEHLKQCSECTSTYEYLKYTDLCISATEKREISSFKKLERYISGKILINYFLFLIAIAIGVVILIFNTNKTAYTTYYLLMPLTMLATGFTFSHTPYEQPAAKRFNILLIIQVLLLLYSIFIMFYAIYAVMSDTLPFSLQPYDVGPLVSTQFKINILLSLIIFLSYLYQVGRKKAKYSVWWNTSILCIFLTLTYDSTLYYMESPETLFNSLICNTVLLFVAGILISFLVWITTKRKQSKMKSL